MSKWRFSPAMVWQHAFSVDTIHHWILSINKIKAFLNLSVCQESFSKQFSTSISFIIYLCDLYILNNIICINNEQMTIYCIIYLPLGIKPRDDKPRVGGDVSASSSRGERTVGRGWTGLGKLSSVIPCSSSI